MTSDEGAIIRLNNCDAHRRVVEGDPLEVEPSVHGEGPAEGPAEGPLEGPLEVFEPEENSVEKSAERRREAYKEARGLTYVYKP